MCKEYQAFVKQLLTGDEGNKVEGLEYYATLRPEHDASEAVR